MAGIRPRYLPGLSPLSPPSPIPVFTQYPCSQYLSYCGRAGRISEDLVPCLLPSLDAAEKGPGVRVALPLVLDRLTGGCVLIRSGAIEDDHLVLGQGGEHSLEFGKGDGPLEPQGIELLFFLVAADENGKTGLDLLVGLLGCDSNGWHDESLLTCVFPSTPCFVKRGQGRILSTHLCLLIRNSLPTIHHRSAAAVSFPTIICQSALLLMQYFAIVGMT